MRSGEHPLRWVPPLVLGICGAVAAEVAAALLLYGGPGMMRSLTAVLSVEAAALGAGLATSPRPRADLGEALRRRWLFALVVFLAAAVFSASWSLVEALGGSAVGQGLGLALLAALPLYAVGGVFGAMVASEGAPGMGARRLGGPAGVGAALGFLGTGLLLPQVFAPASLLLAALVLLSAGGMIYGATLDALPRVDVRARVPSAVGEVRVEERRAGRDGAGARILLESGHVRRWDPLVEARGEGGHVHWDAELLGLLREYAAEAPAAVLVGGGASPLPSALRRVWPEARVTVLERSPQVARLSAEHFDDRPPGGLEGHAAAGTGGGGGAASVLVGNLEDSLAALAGAWSLVVVDTAALAVQGGIGVISTRGREALLAATAPDGILALGPEDPGADFALPSGWRGGRYVRSVPGRLEGLGIPPGPEEVLVLATPGARPLPEAVGGFAWVEALRP